MLKRLVLALALARAPLASAQADTLTASGNDDYLACHRLHLIQLSGRSRFPARQLRSG